MGNIANWITLRNLMSTLLMKLSVVQMKGKTKSLMSAFSMIQGVLPDGVRLNREKHLHRRMTALREKHLHRRMTALREKHLHRRMTALRKTDEIAFAV
uniref:Uncharacterized protein LOC111101719 isoform X5 n=1 Tax=Crassostrea virginica TaxID=6565 RepID=A0A8B8AJ15_CRAVI|nr:uncharacterized protein LOC111101719 isoform X5 [Crassostrea virginica]